MNSVQELQRWYSDQYNGNWDHHHGIRMDRKFRLRADAQTTFLFAPAASGTLSEFGLQTLDRAAFSSAPGRWESGARSGWELVRLEQALALFWSEGSADGEEIAQAHFLQLILQLPKLGSLSQNFMI